MPQVSAGARELRRRRTGLIATVNNHTSLLHQGRAAGVLEAVL